MQEKKRKKKKSTAEQEEQTKKIQSVAETASEQPTAEEPPKESAQKSSKSKQKPTASGSANTKENRRTGWILAEVAISAALLVAMRLTLLHPFLDNWTEVNTMSGSTWLEDNAQQVPLTTTTPDSTDPTGTTDSNKNGNQSDLYKSVSMDNQEIHNGDLILVNNSTESMTMGAAADDVEQLSDNLKYATIVVATLPILCVYPLIQKHFVKGVMIGAVKG